MTAEVSPNYESIESFLGRRTAARARDRRLDPGAAGRVDRGKSSASPVKFVFDPRDP
jgi:hypothetical protein